MKSLLSAEKGQLILERSSGGEVAMGEARHAVTFLRRLCGLLFTRELNFALIIHRCKSVHMMFMPYPIDVIFADKNGKILRCLPTLKPWQISPMVKEAYFVVELPVGSIDSNQARKGDVLRVRLAS